MAVVQRSKRSSSGGGTCRKICCCLFRCVSQFVVVLTWGLTLGVLLAVYRHHNGLQEQRLVDPASQEVRRRSPPADIPLGPDGLPSLAALLEQNKKRPEDPSLRGGNNNAPVKEHPNPHNCELPLQTRIVTIPVGRQSSFELLVWDDGDFLSGQIVDKGSWEISNLDDMAALAPSETLPDASKGAFYDVGANIGYYTFLFAAAGYQAVAFEPDPANAALIRASMCLNPDLKVTLHQVALTNPAESNMDCRLVARVNSRTQKYLHAIPRLFCPVPAQPCEPAKDKICVDKVPVQTLAAIMSTQNLPAPAIVKIDVSGHEWQVLQGLLDTDTTNSAKPHKPATIQFENKDGRIKEQLQQYLEAAGYTVGTARGHDQNTVAELGQIKMKEPAYQVLTHE